MLLASANHKAWSPREKEKALELLKELQSIASGEKIKLMLHAGSLLGAVRHGGIMPWDNDIDISILSTDLPKFIAAIKKDRRNLL